MAHEHAPEQHFPLIARGQQELRRAYVSMLSRLNEDIARELRKSRGLSKGSVFFVLPRSGDTTATLHTPCVPDLVKGPAKLSPDEGKYKNDPRYIFHPTKKRWVKATPEQEKQKRRKLEEAGITPQSAEEYEKEETKRKEQLEGTMAASELGPEEAESTEAFAWFKDEHGNLRYQTEPDEQFSEELSKEEVKELNRNLAAVVTEMDPYDVRELASEVLKVDASVVGTLQEAITSAALEGVSPVDQFAELYGRGVVGEDEDIPDDVLAEAHELYGNLFDLFNKALLEDSSLARKWKFTLEQRESDIRKMFQTAQNQVEFLGDEAEHFNAMVIQEEPMEEADKLTAMLLDVGLFVMPQDRREARLYTDTDAEAKAGIGTLFFNKSRFDKLYGNMRMLLPEQQLAVAVADMVIAARAEFNEDPERFSLLEKGSLEARREYWEEQSKYESGSIAALREQLRDIHGIEYDDDEWDSVVEATWSLAENVMNRVDAFNEHRPEGFILQQLWRRNTTVHELFTDPEVVAKLKDEAANAARKVEQALLAQTDIGREHEIDSTIIDAIKKKYGDQADLFGFQRQAVAWMEAIESGILAYDAGMGKTPISIAYTSNMIKKGKIKRGIIVLPATLVDQWPSEIEKYRPGSKTVVISSRDSLAERLLKLRAINNGDIEADFVVMTASTITHSSDTEEKIKKLKETGKRLYGRRYTKSMHMQAIQDSGLLTEDPIISELTKLDGAMMFDEIHSAAQGLKNSENMQHLYAKEITGRRKYKFGLTATPITASADDLFTLADLFHPGSAGESASWLGNRVMKSQTDELGKTTMVSADPENMRQAKLAIKPYVYFRRKTMKDVDDEMRAVGMGLPEIQAVAHGLTLNSDAQAEYDAAYRFGYDVDKRPYLRAEDKKRLEEYESLSARINEGKKLTKREQERYDKLDFDLSYQRNDAVVEEELMERGFNSLTISRILRNRTLLRQQLASISPRLINRDYTGPEPKIDETVNIVKRHFANPENNDSPVVIFGSFLASLELQKEALIKAGIPEHEIGLITGEQDQDTRSATQDAVNAGQCKVVLIGIKAGGAGLNLQEKSYRAVFLDKPWTPADMEQAIGRVWRTGQKNLVRIHHIKVNGTTDLRKYSRIQGRIDLIDNLAFADLGQDFVSETIRASYVRLLGLFDVDDVKQLPPDALHAFYAKAGLAPGDMPDMLNMKRSDFTLASFKQKIEEERWRDTGDWRLKDMMTLNDLKLRANLINDEQHAKQRKRLIELGQQWLNDVGKAGESTVLQHFGKRFDWESSPDGGVRTGQSGSKPQAKAKNQKELANRKPNEAELVAGGELAKFAATQSASKSKARAAKPKSAEVRAAQERTKASMEQKQAEQAKAAKRKAKPTVTKAPKLHDKSTFTFKPRAVDVSKLAPHEKLLHTAFKRHKPGSYQEALKVTAGFIYDHNKANDAAVSKARAKELASDYLENKGILKKFAKLGLLEVHS